VQLNSAADRKQGFRSADDVPLADTRILFTTAGREPVPTSTPTAMAADDPKRLLGVWERRDHDVRFLLELRSDGVVRKTEGERVTEARYRTAAGALIVDRAPATAIAHFPEPGRLVMMGPSGAERAFTREGVAAAGALSPLIGAWGEARKADGSRDVTTFDADGHFKTTSMVSEKPFRLLREGRYEAERVKGSGSPLALTLTVEDHLFWDDLGEDGLRLTDIAGVVTYWKRPAAGPTPDAPAADDAAATARLVGAWIHDRSGVHVRLELRANGRYAQTLSRGGPEEKTEGTWKLENDYLKFHQDDGESAESDKTVIAHLERGDTLVLTERSLDTTTWTREVATPNAGRGDGEGGRVPDPRPTDDRAALVGTWINTDGDHRTEIELRANGRYVATMHFGAESRTSEGTWKVRGKELVTREDGEEEDEASALRFTDPNTLVLVERPGHETTFTRKR
jgi:uncharacterized protein (TIGR03066 family)